MHDFLFFPNYDPIIINTEVWNTKTRNVLAFISLRKIIHGNNPPPVVRTSQKHAFGNAQKIRKHFTRTWLPSGDIKLFCMEPGSPVL